MSTTRDERSFVRPWLWRAPLAIVLLLLAGWLIDVSRQPPVHIGGLIQAGDWFVTTEYGDRFQARA